MEYLIIPLGTLLVGLLIAGSNFWAYHIGEVKGELTSNNLVHQRAKTKTEQYDLLVKKFFGVCKDYMNAKRCLIDTEKELQIANKDREELGNVIIDLNDKLTDLNIRYQQLYIKNDELRASQNKGFFLRKVNSN